MPQALALWFELFTLMLPSMHEVTVTTMNYVVTHRRYSYARKTWSGGKEPGRRKWENDKSR